MNGPVFEAIGKARAQKIANRIVEHFPTAAIEFGSVERNGYHIIPIFVRTRSKKLLNQINEFCKRRFLLPGQVRKGK